MKRTLCILLALCLALSGLPMALAESDGEVAVEQASDGDAMPAEATDSDLIDLPEGDDAETPLPQADETAARYVRLLGDTPICADADGLEPLATLPEDSLALVTGEIGGAVRLACATEGGLLEGYVSAGSVAWLANGDVAAMQANLFEGRVALYNDDLNRPLPWAEPLSDAADAPEATEAPETDEEADEAMEAIEEDVTDTDAPDDALELSTTDEAESELPRSDVDSAAAPSQPIVEAHFSDEAEYQSVAIDASVDSDALFAAYVNRYFYRTSARRLKTMATANAASQLTGQDLAIYNALKTEIVKVAAGERSDTRFEISASDLLGQTVFTASELGLALDAPTGNTIPNEVKTALKTAYCDQFVYSPNLIVSALWLDCTYELYWLDRYDVGVGVPKDNIPSFSYYCEYSDGEYRITVLESLLTFSFPVLRAYMAEDSNDEYTLDTSLIRSAQVAAENARAIVGRYADDSDYAKLYGYAKEICDLVAYNDDAVKNDWPDAQQDPWKLIWVFDGDESTNVVCEGYAQAFQYLCELTSFDDRTIRCYMVTGNANGAHSWNLVRIGGEGYAVDVTWMDKNYSMNGLSGSMADWINAERGHIFLCGGTGSVRGGYNVQYRGLSGSSYRTYRESDTLALYPESVLTLAESKYVLTGWQKIGGGAYYFDDEGHYLTGVQTIDGKGYVFSDAGRLASSSVTGWQTIDGKDVFFEADGSLHTDHVAVVDAAVAATCTAAGKTAGSHCSVCGATLVEQEAVPATGHNWHIEYSWAADYASVTATRVCANDAAHVEAETVETSKTVTAPTCTAMGRTAYTATFSNAAFAAQTRTVQSIPARGHTAVTDKAVAATCTVAGKTEGSHCSVCGLTLVAQKTVPARGHTAVTDKAVAATCTTAGKTEGSHCSVCGLTLVDQKTIPARGHTSVVDKAVAATCTAEGKTEGSHCSVCKTVLKAQQVVPKLDCTFHMKKSTGKTVNIGVPIQIVVDGKTIKTCSSSNKKVATVTKAGWVSAKKAGTAKITVTLSNKKKLKLTVKVVDPYAPKTVKIVQGKKVTVKKGKTLNLSAVLTPTTAKTTLTWTSSNKKVATVNKSGRVTAKKKGKAKITVKTANGKKATITITVKK